MPTLRSVRDDAAWDDRAPVAVAVAVAAGLVATTLGPWRAMAPPVAAGLVALTIVCAHATLRGSGSRRRPQIEAVFASAGMVVVVAMRLRYLQVEASKGADWVTDPAGAWLYVGSILLVAIGLHLVAWRCGVRPSRAALVDAGAMLFAFSVVVDTVLRSPLTEAGAPTEGGVVFALTLGVTALIASWERLARSTYEATDDVRRQLRPLVFAVPALLVVELVTLFAVIADTAAFPAPNALHGLVLVLVALAARRGAFELPTAVGGSRESTVAMRSRLSLLFVFTLVVVGVLVAAVGGVIEVGGGHTTQLVLALGATFGLTGVRCAELLGTHEAWRVEMDASRDRFRSLVEGVEDAILVIDPVTSAITFSSPAWSRRHGTGHDTLRSRVHADDVALFDAAVGRALDGAGAVALDVRVLRADGAESWQHATVVDRVDNAAVRGVTVVLHDLTERKAFEAALADTHQLTETSLDATGAMVSIVDEAGTVRSANEPWRAVVHDPTNLAAHVGEDLLSRCAELGAAEVEQGLRAALAGDRPDDVQYHSVDRFGEECCWRVRIVPVSVGDAASAVVCVHDVTAEVAAARELARGEARMRALFESVTVGLARLSSSLEIRSANRSLRELVGAAVEGRTLEQLVVEDHREPLVASVIQLLCGEEDHVDVEAELIGEDGERRLVRLTLTRSAADDDDDLVVVVEDVHELRRMEVDLHHAQRLEAVGMLAAGIAHEINTPIQFIGDNLYFALEVVRRLDVEQFEGMDREMIGTELPSALQESLEGVERVAGIVRAMRTFGHRGNDAEQASADLEEMIQDAMVVARNELKYIADLETDFEGLPLVTCHVGDMGQVFVNLLVNAAHAVADAEAESGRGSIVVRTRRDGDDAVIEVEDSGVGMPPEVVKRIFEPFYTTKEVGRGTGQGLSVVHNIIVGRHAGSIEVTTAPGEGTTMSIRLPIAGNRPAEDAGHADHEDPNAAATGTPAIAAMEAS